MSTVKLANESALGVHKYSWTSADGVTCSVQWGEGMDLPLAARGALVAPVRNPARFGFKLPHASTADRRGKQFRDFVQRFADEYESGED